MKDAVCIDTIPRQTSRIATVLSWIVAAMTATSTAWQVLEEWRERGRQRQMLAGLDPAILKDIGVSEADAWAEATKPWWRR